MSNYVLGLTLTRYTDARRGLEEALVAVNAALAGERAAIAAGRDEGWNERTFDGFFTARAKTLAIVAALPAAARELLASSDDVVTMNEKAPSDARGLLGVLSS